MARRRAAAQVRHERALVVNPPVKHGLNGYHDAVARNYAAMDLRSAVPDEAYAWSVTGRRCGALRLTHIYAGGPVEACIAREPREGEARNMILAYVEAGAFEIEQGRRQSLCAAQSMVLMDATRPLAVHQAGATSLYSLILPADFLRTRLREVDAACTRAESAAAGAGAVLRDLLQSSWRQRDALEEQDSRVLAGSFAGLIDCVFARRAPQAAETARLHALRSRIEAVIEAELCNPQLGPALIAERLGLSGSYLFAIAQKLNLSLRQSIINRRLEVCRDVLADGAWSRRTITEIALRWGFEDAAHFSRRFTRKFGMNPKDFRKRSLAALPDSNA